MHSAVCQRRRFKIHSAESDGKGQICLQGGSGGKSGAILSSMMAAKQRCELTWREVMYRLT